MVILPIDQLTEIQPDLLPDNRQNLRKVPQTLSGFGKVFDSHPGGLAARSIAAALFPDRGSRISPSVSRASLASYPQHRRKKYLNHARLVTQPPTPEAG